MALRDRQTGSQGSLGRNVSRRAHSEPDGSWRRFLEGFWLDRPSAGGQADPVEPILAAVSNAPGSFTGIEVNGTSAHQDASATNGEESTQLFGMQTEQVTEGALLNWRRVKGDITRDLEIIAQCQARRPCPAAAQKLINLSLEGAGRSGRARVGVINRAVDLAIRPVSNETTMGCSGSLE